MINKDSVKQTVGFDGYKRRLPEIQRVGSESKTRCPFHKDNDPSLCIYQKNGTWLWKCFPCESGGDIFALVQRMDNCSFAEAVRTVARENGLESDLRGPTTAPPLFDAVSATDLLRTDKDAQDFLAKRGVSLHIAIEAGVGLYRHPHLGDCLAFPYTATDVKLRALNPTKEGGKFQHIPGGRTADRLYLASTLDDPFSELSSERDVYVAESELDCLLLRSHGFNATSVSSATTCLKQRELSILSDDWKELEKADRVFVLSDMDDPGQRCAEAFAKLLPRYKCFRISWPYTKGEIGAIKDAGELYQANPTQFKSKLLAMRDTAISRPPQWRTKFKAVHEMDNSPMEYLVDGFLPEGISFLGALAGSGKTWLALSLAKALTSGDRFLDRFAIPKRRYVLYLVPEAGERSFRARLEKMRLKNDYFLCRTMSDGEMWLDDTDLLEAIRQLRPVVILDTLARFNKADSENDASQTSKGIGPALFNLLAAGAIGVVALHHSPKSSANKAPSLETALRGSGDFGALADAVYSLRPVDKTTNTVEVECVKARDFDAPDGFTIVGRPWIDTEGDFKLLTSAGPTTDQLASQKVSEFIRRNVNASLQDIADGTGIGKNRIVELASQAGWSKPNRKGSWLQDSHSDDSLEIDLFSKAIN